jgi:hypothetical protein
MFEPYLSEKTAKKATKVITAIKKLMSQNITTDDMVSCLAQEFTVTRLTRAFIACAFCMPDFVSKYIQHVYAHFGTGSAGRSSPFAEDAATMLQLFATFDFTFAIKANKNGMAPTQFSLFAFPDGVDPLWVPVEKPVTDYYLNGYALILYQAITGVVSQNMFAESVDTEEEVVIRGTQAFIDMAKSLVNRRVWVVSFLRMVLHPPFETTSTTDQHIYALRCVQHMFNELPLESVQVDKAWVQEGKEMFKTIGNSDLEPNEVSVAYELIQEFLAAV